MVGACYINGIMMGVILYYKLDNFLNQTPPKVKNSKIFDILAPYIESMKSKIVELSDPTKNTYVCEWAAIRP
jgi:hypothetical protein